MSNDKSRETEYLAWCVRNNYDKESWMNRAVWNGAWQAAQQHQEYLPPLASDYEQTIAELRAQLKQHQEPREVVADGKCIADDQWAIDAFYEGYNRTSDEYAANGFCGLKPIIGGIRSLLAALQPSTEVAGDVVERLNAIADSLDSYSWDINDSIIAYKAEEIKVAALSLSLSLSRSEVKQSDGWMGIESAPLGA